MCRSTVEFTEIPQGSSSGPLHFPALLQASFYSISWIKEGAGGEDYPVKGLCGLGWKQLADGAPAGISGVTLMAEKGNRMDTDDEMVSTGLFLMLGLQMKHI